MTYIGGRCQLAAASSFLASRTPMAARNETLDLDWQMRARINHYARVWSVEIDAMLLTPSSVVAFGTQLERPVALKLIRERRDEWHCGDVLASFDGKGCVRVYERDEGVVLMERLQPATSLSSLVHAGNDDDATRHIAGTVHDMMHTDKPSIDVPTVESWGEGFAWYLAGGDARIPRLLVEHARDIYTELATSQRAHRLLHGDLHHDNIVFDDERGWIAIDPKGVVGETEYEIGAMLRNPIELPTTFASLDVAQRRLAIVAEALADFDGERALRWGFAQAVLSAIWSVEDGEVVDSDNASLKLANALAPAM